MATESRRDWRWMLVAAAAAAFFFGSLLLGLADLAAFRARTWTETWDNLAQAAAADAQGAPYDPNPDDWERARWAGEWAVRLAPLNPDYRDVLARVYASRYLSTPAGAAIAQPYLEEAAELSRQAIRLRPAWPYTYVALAQFLARMGRTGQEFEDSLRQALRYGPWEPDILTAIIDMGLLNWDRLPASSRELVLQTILRGQGWTTDSQGNLVTLGDDIWGHVAARHRQLVVCALLPLTDPQLRARCNPASW